MNTIPFEASQHSVNYNTNMMVMLTSEVDITQAPFSIGYSWLWL